MPTAVSRLMIAVSVCAVACGGDASQPMAPPPTPAIGVSSPTASLTIVQGEGDSATITVSRQNGFAGAVQLSVGSR